MAEEEYTDRHVGAIVEMVVTVLDRMFPFSYKLVVAQGTDTVPWHIKLEPQGSERSKYGPEAGVEMILKPKIITSWVQEGRITTTEYAAGVVAQIVTRIAAQALTETMRNEIMANAKASMTVGTTAAAMGGAAVDLAALGQSDAIKPVKMSSLDVMPKGRVEAVEN